MNAISSITGQNLVQTSQAQILNNTTTQSTVSLLMATPKEVAQNIAQNVAEAEASARQMQRIASGIGRTLQFNVNKELGNVVIKIIDPSTDTVIREIPSAEMQQLHIKLRKTMNLFFDMPV